jgi:hypothetical protein
MVGTPDGRWTSLITPGHYVSNFRFKLPQGIPSTIQYEDNKHGFGAEINYTGVIKDVHLPSGVPTIYFLLQRNLSILVFPFFVILFIVVTEQCPTI